MATNEDQLQQELRKQQEVRQMQAFWDLQQRQKQQLTVLQDRTLIHHSPLGVL